MQEKVSKIFSYFENLKHQNIFSLCVQQLIDLYDECPQALRIIIYNMKSIMFSTAKESRLKLRQRQIVAALVGKLMAKYAALLTDAVARQADFDLENFQIEQYNPAASIQNEEEQGNNNNNNNLEGYYHNNSSDWKTFHYTEHIRNNPPLLASETSGFKEYSEARLKELEKEFFQNMTIMLPATRTNVKYVIGEFTNEGDLDFENKLQLDGSDEEDEVAREGRKNKKLKISKKMEKIKKKKKVEEIKTKQVSIFSPFNYIYQLCIDNVLSPIWQLRHLAVLVLKEMLPFFEFVGFKSVISVNPASNKEELYSALIASTRHALLAHLEDKPAYQMRFNQMIIRCILLLGEDRFADYQGDKTTIMIREVGIRILKNSFYSTAVYNKIASDSTNRAVLLSVVKGLLLEKESVPSINATNMGLLPFSWELRHTFVVLINLIVTEQIRLRQEVFIQLKDCLIYLLQVQQSDDVTLAICDVFSQIAEEPFFDAHHAMLINEKAWGIVNSLDDITYSSITVLRLLNKFLGLLKLDLPGCLANISKFFLNKIREVRLQFYKLMREILSKMLNQPGLMSQQKNALLVKQTITQYLQAVIIEEESEIVQALVLLGQKILVYTYELGELENTLVKFTHEVVCNYTLLQNMVKEKFRMPDGNLANNNMNDYLYLAKEEKLEYMEESVCLRIFKTAQVLGKAFWNICKPKLLDSFIDIFMRAGSHDSRLWLVLCSILFVFLQSNSSLQCPVSVSELVNKDKLLAFADRLLKLEPAQLVSEELTLYRDQVIFNLKNYLTSIGDPSCVQPQHSGFANFLTNPQSESSLSVLHQICIENHDAKKGTLSMLEFMISAIETIITIRQATLKLIKLTASYLYCVFSYPQIPKPLTAIIRSAQDSIFCEGLWFPSRVATNTYLALSKMLEHKSRVTYVKINEKLISLVSTKYNYNQINIQRRKQEVPARATYMQAFGEYILEINYQLAKNKPKGGLELSTVGWAEQFQRQLIGGLETGGEIALNQSLHLISGTACELFSACHQQFLQKLISLLGSRLTLHESSADYALLFNVIKRIICFLSELAILTKNKSSPRTTNLARFTGNISDKSNIFMEWFYAALKTHPICISVLQKCLSEDIYKMSGLCSIFLIRVIKSITNPVLQSVAMACLSNLLMGTFLASSKPSNLESGCVPIIWSEKINKKRNKSLRFVNDFKNIKNFEYQIKVKCQFEYRNYQLEGIKWLGFLVKYRLNGALCDDMGLGKTLQTLTVMQNQYIKRAEKGVALPYSLIIAPITLVQHWAYEYKKYFKSGLLKPRAIYKSSDSFFSDSTQSSRYNLIITSYNFIEKNTGMLNNVPFCFLVLDQGHVIKNHSCKKAEAVRSLRAEHRFLLTGTLIQNKLIELWSFFDFLMPGYLHSEEQFKKRYNKLFNVNLMTFKEDDLLFTEEQHKILEALHLKVMPFILRRMKKDVLKELPQKIIQDYLCSMTPAQQKCYKQFSEQYEEGRGSEPKTLIKPEAVIGGDSGSGALVMLTKMRKIVNHPNLLGHKLNYEGSGKFIALKQLLDDLGFDDHQLINPNKVIIFSRFAQTIDLIEELIFRQLYPKVKYIKLTGSSVESSNRFSVAQTFNDSLDIRILLITTNVGGFGLNLTSANVVIMFDHDYNPTIDMQAIDRAHRLGQKNVLNVYRLIMKNTLEQRIMGIQRFKINLANAVVNIDNSSIKNIQESKLPDLLEKVQGLANSAKKGSSEEEVLDKISRSMYQQMIREMERGAIQEGDYDTTY